MVRYFVNRAPGLDQYLSQEFDLGLRCEGFGSVTLLQTTNLTTLKFSQDSYISSNPSLH